MLAALKVQSFSTNEILRTSAWVAESADAPDLECERHGFQKVLIRR
jgi:hypothetical protein